MEPIRQTPDQHALLSRLAVIRLYALLLDRELSNPPLDTGRMRDCLEVIVAEVDQLVNAIRGVSIDDPDCHNGQHAAGVDIDQVSSTRPAD